MIFYFHGLFSCLVAAGGGSKNVNYILFNMYNVADCDKKEGSNICLKNTPKMYIDIGLKREMMQ